MSDPASALPGARFEGLALIEEAGLVGMVTLRGDLSSKALRSAATKLSGTGFPGQGEVLLAGERGLFWMSPDEILIRLPHDEAPGGVAKLEAALKGTHHLAVDVSDARAVFRVRGPEAAEVLSKLTPADLHPDSFGPGSLRRTRIAQVPAAIWMEDAQVFGVICFRSVARYVFDLLVSAARPAAEVRYF